MEIYILLCFLPSGARDNCGLDDLLLPPAIFEGFSQRQADFFKAAAIEEHENLRMEMKVASVADQDLLQHSKYERHSITKLLPLNETPMIRKSCPCHQLNSLDMNP